MIFTDPLQPYSNGQPIPAIQPIGSFVPGVFTLSENADDYISSLDSDTRAYVMQHTDEDRSLQDVIDCVNELHNGHS